MFLFVVLLQC